MVLDGGDCGIEDGGLVGGGVDGVGGGLVFGWVGVLVLFLVFFFFFLSSVLSDMLGVRPSSTVLVAATMVVVGDTEAGLTEELMCLGVRRSAFLWFGSDISPLTI